MGFVGNTFQWTMAAASYTIVQAAIVMALNLMLLLANCDDGRDSGMIFDITREYMIDCDMPNGTALIDGSVIGVEYTYVTLHALWIIAGLVVLTQLCRKKSYLDYILWSVVTLLLLLLDSGMTIYFLLEYMWQLDEYDPDKGFESPAMQMMCISMRVIVFYLFNCAVLAQGIWAVIEFRRAAKVEAHRSNNEQLNQDNGENRPVATPQLPSPESEADNNDDLVIEEYRYRNFEGGDNNNRNNSRYFDNDWRDDDRRGSGHHRGGGGGYNRDYNNYQYASAGPPPPVPSRVKRNNSNLKARHGQQPIIPAADYSMGNDEAKKAPASPTTSKSHGYDMRPFSYINPGFRPGDHADITGMKDHKADIAKTLDEETKQMRDKDLHSETESSAKPKIQYPSSTIVRTFLSESGRRTRRGQEDQVQSMGTHGDGHSQDIHPYTPYNPKPSLQPISETSTGKGGTQSAATDETLDHDKSQQRKRNIVFLTQV